MVTYYINIIERFHVHRFEGENASFNKANFDQKVCVFHTLISECFIQ